jgi:hypothetical protein
LAHGFACGASPLLVPLLVFGDRTNERDLLVAHEELSPSLPERDPLRRVSTLPLQEQVQLLFYGVAFFDGDRIILSAQERDFEVHGRTLTDSAFPAGTKARSASFPRKPSRANVPA